MQGSGCTFIYKCVGALGRPAEALIMDRDIWWRARAWCRARPSRWRAPPRAGASRRAPSRTPRSPPRFLPIFDHAHGKNVHTLTAMAAVSWLLLLRDAIFSWPPCLQFYFAFGVLLCVFSLSLALSLTRGIKNAKFIWAPVVLSRVRLLPAPAKKKFKFLISRSPTCVCFRWLWLFRRCGRAGSGSYCARGWIIFQLPRVAHFTWSARPCSVILQNSPAITIAKYGEIALSSIGKRESSALNYCIVVTGNIFANRKLRIGVILEARSKLV